MCTNGTYTKPINNFSMVSNLITTDLSSKALKIFILIANEIDKKNKTFYKNTIANKFDGCLNTFNKYWSELKEKGYLIQIKKRDSQNHWTYEYTLNSAPNKETLKNQQSSQIPIFNKSKNRTYNKTKLNKTKYSSSSTKSPTNENKVISTLKNNNINISISASNELNQFICNYGFDFVMRVVDYCVDRGAKTFAYIRSTFNNLFNKNIFTIEAFNKSIEEHVNKRRINKELKEKRLAQSNSEMKQKLDKTNSNASNRKETNTTVKKTRFNAMNSRDWDFEELDAKEEIYIAQSINKITEAEANELYSKINNYKWLYDNEEMTLEEYKSKLNEIVCKCR